MTTRNQPEPRVVLLGTYDLGKPRTRLLRECLQRIDPDLRELHFGIWQGVEDKSVMTGLAARLTVILRLALAYPVLGLRYFFTGKHDVVVIGYMGLFDMLLLAPLAKLRGKPVVWDAFLSIYDTYARDRAMAAEHHWKSRLLRWAEKRACRLADRVVLDTMAHASLMGELHDVPKSRLDAVLVGAEERNFLPSATSPAERTADPIEILFYGQFIPLHGIDTIIDAALDPRGRQYSWSIVGQGQEADRIDSRLASLDTPNITRIPWIDYDELSAKLASADVCLGIFGTSDKAARVIPNKVFQALAVGAPLITRDSPAMRELVCDNDEGIYLVSPGDPQSLLDSLDQFARDRTSLPSILHCRLRERFDVAALTNGWRKVLERAITV